MCKRIPELGGIIGMDDCLYDRLQPAHARFIRIRYIQTEEIDHALVEESRLAIRRQTPNVARNQVHELRERLDRVRKQVGGSPRPRVYAMEWLDPPFSAGHWVPEMVEIAGGHEVLGKTGLKSARISPESIVEAKPEIVVLMPCGFSLDRTIDEYHRTKFFAGWEELPAVRNNKVYAVDGSSYFNRSGPRLIDGVEILAEIFHSRGADVPYRHIERLS